MKKSLSPYFRPLATSDTHIDLMPNNIGSQLGLTRDGDRKIKRLVQDKK